MLSNKIKIYIIFECIFAGIVFGCWQKNPMAGLFMFIFMHVLDSIMVKAIVAWFSIAESHIEMRVTEVVKEGKDGCDQRTVSK